MSSTDNTEALEKLKGIIATAGPDDWRSRLRIMAPGERVESGDMTFTFWHFQSVEPFQIGRVLGPDCNDRVVYVTLRSLPVP